MEDQTQRGSTKITQKFARGGDDNPGLGLRRRDDMVYQGPEDEDRTETIDLASLFTNDLSATGSFDIKGDIWATTFGKVLQALPIPAFLIDRKCNALYGNQACSKISCTYEKILGTPFPSLFPNSEVSQRVQLVLDDVFSTRKTKVGEAVMRIGESRIWARMTFRSVRIMLDRFILALIEDLSSEKKQIQLKENFRRELEQQVEERTSALRKAKEALEESEERFRALVETTSDFIWEMDTGWLYTYASPRIKELLGYEPQEILGKAPFALMPESEATRFASKLQAVAKSGMSFRGLQAISRSKDGRLVVIERSGVPFFNSRRELLGYRGMDRDISYRKQAEDALRKGEEKYRSILETIADGYHETDLKGNLVLVNDSLCDITEYSREELLSFNYQDLMDAANARLLAERYGEVHRTGVAETGFDLEILRKDGTKRQVSLSITLARDLKGRPTVFRGVLRDVTRQKQAQEQLQQAAKMEAVGQLAGGIAHDFNNLLTAVIGYTDILKQQVPAEDHRYKKLLQIGSAAKRGAALTRQLLAFSRKQVLDVKVLNINEVITGMEDMLRSIIGEQVALETAYSPTLEHVRGDLGQIEQIVMNLVVNARDAMPNGGKLIIETENALLGDEYCGTEYQVRAGSYVMFSVSDNGQGIEPEYVPHIFDPFFTTKEKGVGTGLGLSTVYGIVKQHRGHVAVDSEKDRGTTFRIYLPRVLDFPESVPKSTFSAPKSQGGETVLVVEDEQAVRRLTCEALELQGYRILSASNQEEARSISACHEGPIHLLLSDVILPQTNGRSLYEALSVGRPQMKVLYMSGYTENHIVHHGVLDPGVHFLTKPFSFDDLVSKVRCVLDEHP